MFIPLLISLLSFFVGHAQKPEKVKVGYLETPPLVYHQHNEQLRGLTYELTSIFLQDAEVFHVEYLQFFDKKAATTALEEGSIDLFLGNLEAEASPNIVTTMPYMIDATYTLPQQYNFVQRLSFALNWQDFFIKSIGLFVLFSTFSTLLLVIFDAPHNRQLRYKTTSFIFFHQQHVLFSSFTRNSLSMPASPVGRIITATWSVLSLVFLVSLTSVITSSLLASSHPSVLNVSSLNEVSGQRVGFIDDGFGTNHTLGATSSLVRYSTPHDLVTALNAAEIDYAVVSGAYFSYAQPHEAALTGSKLATTPLTLNPQVISLNRRFAESMVFEKSNTTYLAYFNHSITRAMQSLSLYQLCSLYLTSPYHCVF